ncbi:MAG: HEAT repeat domain-containing protein [Planctomycetes bacterium]|nr:HEAT repeat domain-containing protein [Planctomycetota bacterium]
MHQGTLSLSGVVEPWEVWWSNNRDRYLSFREPVEWSSVMDDGKGSKSVTVYPVYDELINVLVDGLSNKNSFVAFRAAISLSKVPDALTPAVSSQKAAEQLKKSEESENRFFVRNNVLLALGFIGDDSAGETARRVLMDNKKEGPLRRSYAALALGYLPGNNSELTKTLMDVLSDRSDNHEVRCCAALSLGNLKDVSAVPLLGKMLNQSEGGKKEPPAVRSYAALGLGRIATKEALDELRKSTPASEKEADVRTAVVMALGMTGLPEAGDSIAPFLRDRYSPVRGYAALALSQTKNPKSYEIISELFHKEKFVEADGLMALALGLTGNEKAKADLRKILENKKARSPLFKASAAIGLGLLKDTEAVPLIVNMLSNEKQQSDTLLTPYLILALGMIKDPRGVEPLQKLWDKLPEKSYTYPYHSNLAIALTMLGRKKDIVMPALVKQAGQTQNQLLRSHAIHSLGLIGDRESAGLLVSSAADKDNTFIMYTTMSAIGFLMDKNRLNPLNKITGNLIDVSSQIRDHIGGIPVW